MTRLYLDLMKRCLMDTIYADVQVQPTLPIFQDDDPIQHPGLPERTHASSEYCELCRSYGRDVPAYAHTMIGLDRLNNIQSCVEQVLKDNIPGDLAETGVWRGGAAIFMRAILKAYGSADRIVWAADSFKGFPPEVAVIFNDKVVTKGYFEVSLEQVQRNFDKYGLLDDQVRFLPGWFCDTLPAAPIEKLAVLRLDGDLYRSTYEALEALYPKLSVGGFLIVDDFLTIPDCKRAVQDYCLPRGIVEDIYTVDWTAVYWRKTR